MKIKTRPSTIFFLGGSSILLKLKVKQESHLAVMIISVCQNQDAVVVTLHFLVLLRFELSTILISLTPLFT